MKERFTKWFAMMWHMVLGLFDRKAMANIAYNNEGAVTVPFTPAAAPREPQRKPTSGWWRVLKKSRHRRPYPV